MALTMDNEKMRQKKLMMATVLLLTPIFLLGALTNDLRKSELDIKRITRSVAYSLPVFHLNQLELDENVSTNAFELFIDSLDPTKSYFLQSDIDAFMAEAPILDKNLRKGDISFATNVYSVLMDRMKNRNAFIDQLLKQGFDTTIEETYVWDRADATWPKDEAGWDDLWRKRIKNDYISRLVAQQVYTGDKEDKEKPESERGENTESKETEPVEYEYDEASETATMSPEEFIRKRYEQYYLTMSTFDEEMILQRYLTSFSEVYDPHSTYMSPSSVEDFDINMKLSLVGIGAMLRPDDGTARIVRIIPGGPADLDGRLKAGDRIIAVGDGKEEPTSIMHWPLYKAVRLIRGKKDTNVELTIIPASDRTGTMTRKISLIRDEVKLEDQEAKGSVEMIHFENGTSRRLGVITLPDFYADFKASSRNPNEAKRASTDVLRIIEELKAEEVEGLVFDLRNNGGGSLLEAIEIAGFFIPSGPIVQVKEQKGVQVLPDANPELNYDGPMVVLVNRLSASASEILAAALQDYKRAIIVGDKQTHGKGTVQTLMPLGSERSRRGSLKLTTASFYRINGGSTQLKGVTPDIIIPSYLDVMDIGEDSLKHALPWDEIRPAMYRAVNGLSPLIPLLAEQSRERLESSEEFNQFMERRQRLKERYERKCISLSLAQRLREAEEEKELDKIQTSALMDDETDEKKSKDIIRDEALQILSDLIDLKKGDTRGGDLLAPASFSANTTD
jgi:carboxyl-terminal processing protease